jgi:hypothetical protein
MPSYIDHFIQFYSHSSISFGAGDICCADAPHSSERAGAFGLVMLLARDEAGQSLVKRVVVIMPPPKAVPSIDATSIRASAISGAERFFGRSLREEELAGIASHLIPTHAASFATASVLKAFETASKSDAVVILCAAQYRSANQPGRAVALDEPTFREDHWVSHLGQLARLIVDRAKERGCYVLLDAGEDQPYRKKNKDALMAIPDCGLFTVSTDRSDVDSLVANWRDWLREVHEGHVAHVFASIDALPQSLQSHKGFIKLQLVADVVPAQELLKMLRAEIGVHQQIDPSARVKLAVLAIKAQDDDLAIELLRPAIPELLSEEDLETALAVVEEASDEVLTEAAVECLALLFPESPKLIEHTVKQLMDQRKYSGVISLLDGPHPAMDPDLEFFYKTVSSAFQAQDHPEYETVIKLVAQTVPTLQGRAHAFASREALARRDFETSVALCIPDNDQPLAFSTARILLWATRQALLQREDGELILNGDQLLIPVVALIKYLSANPLDGRIRIGLMNLLSVEVTGSLGLAIAVSAVMNLAGSTVAPLEYTVPRKDTENPVFDLSAFLHRAIEWMSAEGPLILGITKFPVSLLPAPADEVFEAVRMLIRHHEDLRDNDSEKAFEYTVYTGILLAPLTSTPNEDLEFLRYAGAQLVTAHRLQRSRDFAEQALSLTRNSPERRRLAWLAFADIYHRAHNVIESLIALSCTFAVETPVDVRQLMQEVYLLVRVPERSAL